MLRGREGVSELRSSDSSFGRGPGIDLPVMQTRRRTKFISSGRVCSCPFDAGIVTSPGDSQTPPVTPAIFLRKSLKEKGHKSANGGIRVEAVWDGGEDVPFLLSL